MRIEVLDEILFGKTTNNFGTNLMEHLMIHTPKMTT